MAGIFTWFGALGTTGKAVLVASVVPTGGAGTAMAATSTEVPTDPPSTVSPAPSETPTTEPSEPVDPAEPVPVTPPTEPSTPAPEPSEPADPEPAPSEPAPTPSDPAVPAPAPTQPEEPGDSGDDETGEHAGTPKPTTAPGNSAWAHANAAEHRAAGQANADLHRNAGHREGGDEREHSGTTATTDAGHGDHGKGHDK